MNPKQTRTKYYHCNYACNSQFQNFSKSLPQKYKDKTKEQLLLQSISTLANSLPKIEKNKKRLHNSITEFRGFLTENALHKATAAIKIVPDVEW